MKTLALALGGLAVWVAAPPVAMAAHGTIDQRRRAASWARVPAPRPLVTIPTQRGVEAGTRVPA